MSASISILASQSDVDAVNALFERWKEGSKNLENVLDKVTASMDVMEQRHALLDSKEASGEYREDIATRIKDIDQVLRSNRSDKARNEKELEEAKSQYHQLTMQVAAQFRGIADRMSCNEESRDYVLARCTQLEAIAAHQKPKQLPTITINRIIAPLPLTPRRR